MRSGVVPKPRRRSGCARSSCRCRTPRSPTKRSYQPSAASLISQSAKCPRGRDRVDHAGGKAPPDQPVRAEVGRRDGIKRRLRLVEALVEAVAAVFDIVRADLVGDHRIARHDDVQPSEGKRIHAPSVMPPRRSRRFDGEVRLAQPIGRERPRPAGCSCRPRTHRPACSGSDRARPTRRRHGT